jgi:predicted transposase YdaD
MKYDIALKSLLQTSGLTILEQLAGVRLVRWLNVELPEVRMPHLDLLAETAARDLLHFELQSNNDSGMPLRMAEYALAIYRQYGRFPRQFVLYVGQPRLSMRPELRGPFLHFWYTAVDIREMDPGQLLNSPAPGDNILAILADVNTPEKTVREVLKRITRLPPAEQPKQLQILMILSGLRGLGKLIQSEVKRMPITVDLDEVFGDYILERADLYREQGREQGLEQGREQGLEQGREQGLEQGREQGQVSLLHRQMANRFGPIPAWAEDRLKALPREKLEDLAVRLLNANSLEDLFNAQSLT